MGWEGVVVFEREEIFGVGKGGAMGTTIQQYFTYHRLLSSAKHLSLDKTRHSKPFKLSTLPPATSNSSQNLAKRKPPTPTEILR
jgi:hypothetical protein